MIGEATYIACRHKQQLLPSTKHELPAWIYVRGKVRFKSICCLEGIECGLHFHIYSEFRHTSKNFEGGLQKTIFEKNTVLWKKGVNMGVWRCTTIFCTLSHDQLRVCDICNPTQTHEIYHLYPRSFRVSQLLSPIRLKCSFLVSVFECCWSLGRFNLRAQVGAKAWANEL